MKINLDNRRKIAAMASILHEEVDDFLNVTIAIGLGTFILNETELDAFESLIALAEKRLALESENEEI